MHKIERLVAGLAAIAVLALSHPLASAVALRLGKATDESVCDLGPQTTYTIGRKILIPSARSDLEGQAYLRYATRFVAGNCSNGQILVLHSDDSRSLDTSYLPEVATAACVASDVSRTPTSGRNRVTDATEQGFELRCLISKIEKLRSDVNAREEVETTEAFVRRLHEASTPRTGGAPTVTDSGGTANKKDCGKMMLASILMSGACQ